MYRTYLLISTVATTLLALAVTAFCFIIDPYDLYPSLGKADRQQQVDLFYHLRLHKPYAMESRRSHHLVVGSSRSARLPPKFLAQNNERSYNAALPGVTLREMRLMVEHAQAIQPLKSVVIGIDYYMFREGHSAISGHFEEARLRKIKPTSQQNLARYFQRFEDHWKSLLSVDALLIAWNTLRGEALSQRRYKKDGTWEAELDRQKTGSWLFSMLVKQKYDDFSRKTDQLDMTELAALLAFCDDHGIQALILISPFHASITNTVSMAGKWNQYLDWQRQVTEISAAYPNSTSIFALESSSDLVLEAIDGERRFFQDGVHYTGMAGRSVMACLTGSDCDSTIKLITLNTANSASYFDEVTRLMKNYRHSNPSDFARVPKWLGHPTQNGQ